jgi:hypothetical protein
MTSNLSSLDTFSLKIKWERSNTWELGFERMLQIFGSRNEIPFSAQRTQFPPLHSGKFTSLERKPSQEHHGKNRSLKNTQNTNNT